MDLDRLRRLDAYLDAAPRSSSRTETIGPFTPSVNRDGDPPNDARPRRGAAAIDTGDVGAVRGCQRASIQVDTRRLST